MFRPRPATTVRIPDAEESHSGYDRTLFRHWADVDGDCQDTRAEVLLGEAEADTPITYTTSGRCRVATGRSFSTTTGARTWARRQAFANDLDDYRTLVGVAEKVNQSESDQDPSTWLPAVTSASGLL